MGPFHAAHARRLSAIDKPGQIADVCLGKVADIADIRGNSPAHLQHIEALRLEEVQGPPAGATKSYA